MMVTEEVYDVIVVGAGPCGLSTAARLREHTPAALFTDEEHRRYHWISKYGNKVATKNIRNSKVSFRNYPTRAEYSMLVLDATDDNWLTRWKSLFNTYDISHLRSPMLWHVDPLDRDSLLAHAFSEERADELVEIKNCVGRELSKHAKKKKAGNRACGKKQEARVAINLRERNDYYTPSQSLFVDHCHQVAQRYDLEANVVKRETVQDIGYGVVRGVSIGEQKLFTIATNVTRRYAKAVVLAVGAANLPEVPHLPSLPMDKSMLRQACHSIHIKEFPDTMLRQMIKEKRPTNVLIVGGGLTSAQLSDLAIRRGVTKVWHMMRGPCRVKHFDVDLQWMGKYKNAEQARFWSADSDFERLELIKEARGGGSITPPFHKILKKHVASGRLKLCERTCLLDAKFEGEGGIGSWRVTTNPTLENMPPFDYIYFATGIQTDFRSLPYLQTMFAERPILSHGGFPCLNDDLMWEDGVPLFLVGKLASLKLGPAAPNLGGAKLGAERVAWAIEHLIEPSGASNQDSHEDGGLTEYLSGHGNMYRALAC